MSALSIAGLSKRFGAVEVLKGIELEIESGEFVVLVGPSGCGKSTLLGDHRRARDGERREDPHRRARSSTRSPPKDRDIAMVFQSYALYPTMTARQNITFGMECRRRAPAERSRRSTGWHASCRSSSCSTASRPSSRAASASGSRWAGRWCASPLLFLFDEPLSNLDAKLRVEMRTEIKKLHQRLGTTIVYVTHDQVEAMTLATRIAVMHQGQIQQFAEPKTVYDRPANLVRRRVHGLAAMNFLPARLAPAGDRLQAVISEGADAIRLPLAATAGAGAGGLAGARGRARASGPNASASGPPNGAEGTRLLAELEPGSRWSSRRVPRPWP